MSQKSIRRSVSCSEILAIGQDKRVQHLRSYSSDREKHNKIYLKDTTLPKSTPVRIRRRSKDHDTFISFRDHVSSLRRSPSPIIRRTLSSRNDRRPLTDNEYQMTLLNKIDSFFYVNCRRMLNSNGSLKPITLKTFVKVSNFLLKYLDVKQDLTMEDYIDELPKCARKLHYPGTITKSWLKIANTMHSWPYVLGWIGWLIEACQVREIALNGYKLENLPFKGTQQQAQSSSMEFQALLECYKAYNEEKFDEEEELLNRYLQDVLGQKSITDDDIAQARKELEEEKIKLQAHKNKSQKLDEKIEYLQQKLASLRAKESKQLHNKIGEYR
ncbi:kinetochore protein NDC80 homolog [Solenopsis invicta]|uniref:kinetochore protein NDC80 homolog n=1 Tax=Solenopsis invicta TaxID=13686 RepID=UPI000E33E073|nr:kinetochore protein NDC80 homolog [Solenopsis invicta]